MSTPRQCRSCNSLMKDVRLCLSCHTAHELDLPSNRGHSKIECTNPWHAEGVAAPLEPSAEQFYEANEVERFDKDFAVYPEGWFKFAEAYAAAVSKNLQEELAAQTAATNYWRDATQKEEGRFLRASARILELEKEITALRSKR